MFKVIEEGPELRVDRSQYVSAIFFTIVTFFSIASLIGTDSLKDIGLIKILGIALLLLFPIFLAHYLIEFSCFTFSNTDRLFKWERRGVFHKENGNVPYEDIKNIRRESLDNTSSPRLQYRYRLVVVTKEDKVIFLSRSYSSQDGKRLDETVERIRKHTGIGT